MAEREDGLFTRALGRPAWLGAATLLLLIAAQVVAIRISPPDRDMGDLQKIMYVHVLSAWAMSFAFAVVFLYSVLYLWRRRESYDLLAASAAEVGVVLNGLTLVLGMIWGRPAWGAWWVWDPRLTSTLVQFLIFVGYLALRALVEDPEQRARWSAAVGIIGALNVSIVYMSVRWWRTIHQMQSTPSTIDPQYTVGLLMNSVAFTVMLIYFTRRRYQIACVERDTEAALQDAAMRGAGSVGTGMSGAAGMAGVTS